MQKYLDVFAHNAFLDAARKAPIACLLSEGERKYFRAQAGTAHSEDRSVAEAARSGLVGDLMQMAKVSAALARLSQERIPYISVLTDPTTGGVAASFAMLGDITLAEPKALIGFAGPRVIEQTIRQKLPEGFQRSEFLLEHGMIDRIVQRSEMREEISVILKNLGFGG